MDWSGRRAPRPDRPAVTAVAGVNPLRSYSGVIYLCNAIAQRGLSVQLWAMLPLEALGETAGWAFHGRSFLSCWYMRVPKVRVLIQHVHALFLGLAAPRAVVMVDTTFHLVGILLRWIRPKLVIIQYAPELYLPDAKGALPTGTRCFMRHPDVADCVIDVEPTRARLRRDAYRLHARVVVVPNTIPRSEVPPRATVGTMEHLAGGGLPRGAPIVLYAGATLAGLADRSFERILKAVALTRSHAVLLAFVHGPDVDAVRRLSRLICGERARICEAVPRRVLLSCMHEADAGLVYYPPDKDVGTRFCAPTKVFEYIACGLPVVASCNPSLVDLLSSRGLGACASEDTAEALACAIDDVVSDPVANAAIRTRQLKAFQEELCYEVAAQPALCTVVDTIGAGRSLAKRGV